MYVCSGGHLCKPRGIRLQKHTFGREERARLQCSPVIISASPGVRSQSQQLCLQGLWALGECVSRTQHSSDVNTKPTAHHKTSNLHKTHTLPHVSTLSEAACDLFLLNSDFKRYQIQYGSCNYTPGFLILFFLSFSWQKNRIYAKILCATMCVCCFPSNP